MPASAGWAGGSRGTFGVVEAGPDAAGVRCGLCAPGGAGPAASGAWWHSTSPVALRPVAGPCPLCPGCEKSRPLR
ncbi:predicted protein [Streptomyces lividans TK24]|nr:predicted protein [Streptomyces lividans TK24]